MFMIRFFKTMLLLPKPWVAWVALLMGVNMMASLVFINTLEGKMVFAAGMVGAMVMMLIFRFKGFVRLLGVGHLFWIPFGDLAPGTSAGSFGNFSILDLVSNRSGYLFLDHRFK